MVSGGLGNAVAILVVEMPDGDLRAGDRLARIGLQHEALDPCRRACAVTSARSLTHTSVMETMLFFLAELGSWLAAMK